MESVDVNGEEVCIMEHDRPLWRFRLSTLMLLVAILALALALVTDHWKMMQEMRRHEAEKHLALESHTTHAGHARL